MRQKENKTFLFTFGRWSRGDRNAYWVVNSIVQCVSVVIFENDLMPFHMKVQNIQGTVDALSLHLKVRLKNKQYKSSQGIWS